MLKRKFYDKLLDWKKKLKKSHYLCVARGK